MCSSSLCNKGRIKSAAGLEREPALGLVRRGTRVLQKMCSPLGGVLISCDFDKPAFTSITPTSHKTMATTTNRRVRSSLTDLAIVLLLAVANQVRFVVGGWVGCHAHRRAPRLTCLDKGNTRTRTRTHLVPAARAGDAKLERRGIVGSMDGCAVASNAHAHFRFCGAYMLR